MGKGGTTVLCFTTKKGKTTTTTYQKYLKILNVSVEIISNLYFRCDLTNVEVNVMTLFTEYL